MPKIKNWKKTNEKVYENKISKNTIIRIRIAKGAKGWVTIITKIVKSDVLGKPAQRTMIEQPVFDTKQKARKFAVKWMRNHPNGE